MSFPLNEVWSELLRSTSNNEAILKELLEGRPEVERATDLNCMLMNYISIIYKVFNIKIEREQIDPRVWLPSDHDFIEMLKLLVRYINDITTWIEDHDQTGVPWTSIGEFYAKSLLEVDAQCQRWWVLADMTIFNPVTTPFKTLPTMPLNEENILEKFNPATFNRFQGAPSLSHMEDSPTEIGTFRAPPSPASSSSKRRQPSATASSSISCQPSTMSLDKGQMPVEFTDSWNDGGDSSFSSHNSYCDIDQSFLYNGGLEPGGLAVQQTPVFIPRTPRLEQKGFAPSPNPSLSFQTPVDKRSRFYQQIPPPARKIAIPRLEKHGTFEPLLPATEHSEHRPSLHTPQTSTSGPIRKRGYTDVLPQALRGNLKKRRVVAGEIPQRKSGYTGMQEFPPGPKPLHGSLGSIAGFSSGSYNTNHSASAASSPVERNGETLRTNLNSVSHKVAIGSQMDWSNTISTENSPQGRAGNILTTQQDWNDTVSAAFDSEQGAANTGLGISSPEISRDSSNFPGIPMMCTDMSIGNARPARSQQPIYFSSPIHPSPITGSNSQGASHKSSRRLHHGAVKRDYVLGEDQSLKNDQSNVFKQW
ncbi:uncharacterized protein EAF01_007505 [Botrytis porri]|uniref:Uncharacterized protein n=1 Tax=Botrytis porri TaxID=87229 RepID=A0A4Z1KEX9_9HELO|nr:uncharacterized protein EAF01_007505 [Botrytis porri]KAF7900202.1 hypothetical protein EAF01_007505 [Botrytis porri]TGO83886.1 hypothetical protein BPOR_0579g00050 [Botrytis porri]